jgi:hypothetical protein
MVIDYGCFYFYTLGISGGMNQFEWVQAFSPQSVIDIFNMPSQNTNT